MQLTSLRGEVVVIVGQNWGRRDILKVKKSSTAPRPALCPARADSTAGREVVLCEVIAQGGNFPAQHDDVSLLLANLHNARHLPYPVSNYPHFIHICKQRLREGR